MRKYLPFVVISLVSVTLGLVFYHFFVALPGITEVENNARFASDSEIVRESNKSPLFEVPRRNDLFTGISNSARAAVVSVRATRVHESGYFREKYSRSNGSGVIISSDGYLVTNYHVVEDANDIEVRLEDKREFRAQLVGHDLSTDIALLKLDATALPFMAFGNSDSLQVGEWVLAVGNPFKLQSSVTAGIVSAKARNINIFDRQGIESFIQTDAAINPGNSGGALIDTDGFLVGINTAIMSYSGKYEGFSFAVPSNLVKKVVDDIRSYGAVQRAWLGASVFDVNEQRARKAGLGFIGGVYLDVVDRKSAAKDAGLISGDVIVSVDGTPTMSTPAFLETLARYRPGDEVDIVFFRKGKRHTTRATLRNQLNTTDFVAVRKDPVLKALGFELRELNKLEMDQFDRDGILVVSIYKSSTIAETNMDPGYIITSINDKRVDSVDTFIEELKRSEGKEVTLKGFYENYPGEWPYIFIYK